MRIAIFSFTRDRLKYTRDCFYSLYACKEFQDFDHYIIDNGSIDGTKKYLIDNYTNYKSLVLSSSNLGLHKASAIIKDLIQPCDLVIKVDNDCFFSDPKTLFYIVKSYKILTKHNKGKCILSPTVQGIVNQPKKGEPWGKDISDNLYEFRYTGQIGGLCMAIPYELFTKLDFNINLPKARGLDSNICQQAILNNYSLIYANYSVTHYEGTLIQAKRYPAYFIRKKLEEKAPWKNH